MSRPIARQHVAYIFLLILCLLNSSSTLLRLQSSLKQLLQHISSGSDVIYDPSASTSTPISLPAKSNSIQDDSKSKSKIFKVANGTRYALVHVGKTAGSTIGCAVFDHPNLKCNNRRHRLDYALRRAFVCRLHMHGTRRIKECEEQQFDMFLFTLRNPLDRLVSWFYYERKFLANYKSGDKCNGCLCRLHNYGDYVSSRCFRDVDEFAKAAVPFKRISNNNNNTESTGQQKQRLCQQLAFDVARGKQRCTAHNSFNYEYYVHLTKTLKEGTEMYPILAIRQEHLGEDWDTLEAAFGGRSIQEDERTGSQIFQTTINPTFPRSIEDEQRYNSLSFLSDAGRENLCVALCRDIQVYKYILFHAENLNESQVRQSILEVMNVCPEESSTIHDCSPETDDIHWTNLFENSKFDIKEYVDVSNSRRRLYSLKKK